MSVKFIKNQDLGKLEKLINKELALGELRLHSLTQGVGMFIAVLETKPALIEMIAQPPQKPAPKADDKGRGRADKKADEKADEKAGDDKAKR